LDHFGAIFPLVTLAERAFGENLCPKGFIVVDFELELTMFHFLGDWETCWGMEAWQNGSGKVFTQSNIYQDLT
jgi:hypothetical protein